MKEHRIGIITHVPEEGNPLEVRGFPTKNFKEELVFPKHMTSKVLKVQIAPNSQSNRVYIVETIDTIYFLQYIP